jgi:aerobic-type carbon monoxide dehydrogenase small subunit (CoxS/CutS family)
VHLNGAAIRSCVTRFSGCGPKITTIEAVGNQRVGQNWAPGSNTVTMRLLPDGQVMSATALPAWQQNPVTLQHRRRHGR